MREYILLLFIALVGISGLFTIHHEVKMSERDHAAYLPVSGLSPLPLVSSATVVTAGKLVLQEHSDTASINLRIHNYDPDAVYYLDRGDGLKTKVTSPDFLVKYQHSGVFFVKLLKNNILEDVIEVTIPGNDANSGGLVTYQAKY
ncbi:MAG: hypothetical protein HKN76_02630 [Saprospiraceae bacterium]|nr:hypothetical protein [Saprospiraceae bacterium]